MEVHTSNVRGAGTDANVSIALRGDSASTLPVPLEASRDDFKRGRVDRFFVATRPLGTLLAALVSHDNSGRGSSWHLNRVLVTPPGASQPVCFPCGRCVCAHCPPELASVLVHSEDGPCEFRSHGLLLHGICE